MKSPFSFIRQIAFAAALLAVLGIFSQASAQDAAKSPEPSAAAPDAAPAKKAKKKVPPRNLAPHVFQRINPFLDDTNIVSVHDFEPIAVKYPDYEWAKNLSYRQKIWYFDIEIKPMRVIWVDLPNAKTGKLRRVPVWYILYKVKNPNRTFNPVAEKLDKRSIEIRDEILRLGEHPRLEERPYYKTQTTSEPLRFIPIFELITGRQYVDGDGQIVYTEDGDAVRFNPKTDKFENDRRRYVDLFLPIAVNAIRIKEDKGVNILDSVQMSNRDIQPDEEVWGVATWLGVNPTVDRFSVYVNGLTNARMWIPDAADPTKGFYKYKTLKLNYWHPSDESALSQDSAMFKLGPPDDCSYEWVLRDPDEFIKAAKAKKDKKD